MGNAILILLAVVLTGCGRGVETSTEYHVDSEFTEYSEAFEAASVERGLSYKADVSIEFGDVGLEYSAVAGCKRPLVGGRHIVVDRVLWDRLESAEREVIIFHELGHCILNRSHDDRKDNGQIVSLMYFAPVGVAPMFQREGKKYLDELFGVNQ